MKDDVQPCNAMTELPAETRKWLAGLSADDIATMQTGLPLIRMVVGFGKVTRWIVLTAAGILLGGVLLWDAVLKILTWMQGR